jgi:hypothetical protein
MRFLASKGLRVSSVLGLALATQLIAGCGSSASERARVSDDESAGVKAEALASDALTYFHATSLGGFGYVVEPVNRVRIACDAGVRASEACFVSSVDLSSIKTTDADSRAILGTLDGESARTIVLVGTLTSSSGLRALKVSQAWRAPIDVPYAGALYYVSRAGIACVTAPCDPVNAIRVNAWKAFTAPSLDLSDAPADPTCRFLPKTQTPCSGPYDLPEAAASLPAGLLVAGYRASDGSIVANQYFVQIGVGGTCDDGGLSYCGALDRCDTTTGLCMENCDAHSCTHGRGRGVMPYDPPTDVSDWLSYVEATDQAP